MTMVKNLNFSRFGFCSQRFQKLTVALLAGAAFVAGVGQSSAQAQTTVSLWSGTGAGTGAVFSVDGLNISVTGCSVKIASVNQSCTNASGAALYQLTYSTASNGAQLLINGVAGVNSAGSNIFSAAAGTGLYDLHFTLSVSSIVPKTTVSSATMTLAGSAKTSGGAAATGDYNYVSGGETLTGTSGTLTSLSTSLNGPTQTGTFAPVTSFNVSKDLKLDTSNPGVGVGDTLVLSSVRQIYSPAPEPAAIGVFLVGLVGLGAVRQRIAGSTRAAAGSAEA